METAPVFREKRDAGHDVVVFGARLAFLVDLLRDHKLTAVWPLAERYSNLEPSQPFVSAIAIRPLGDKSDGAGRG